MIKNRFYSFIKKKLKVEKGQITFDPSLYSDKYENNVDDVSYVSSYKEDEEEEFKDNDYDEPLDNNSSAFGEEDDVIDSEEDDVKVSDSTNQQDNGNLLVQRKSIISNGEQQNLYIGTRDGN